MNNLGNETLRVKLQLREKRYLRNKAFENPGTEEKQTPNHPTKHCPMKRGEREENKTRSKEALNWSEENQE